VGGANKEERRLNWGANNREEAKLGGANKKERRPN
jgi:hypothetical protein